MVSDKAKRTTISILRETKDALDTIKHTGQSYDGLIQELVRLWKKQHGVEETSERSSAVERGRGAEREGGR